MAGPASHEGVYEGFSSQKNCVVGARAAFNNQWIMLLAGAVSCVAARFSGFA
jgi:hypothetical protein